MAIYHVDTHKISKGKTPGGSAGFAAYLERRDQGHATRAAAYLERYGREMEDLVDSGSASLPRWAKSGAHLWAMADRFERGGPHRHGVVARHYQITIPRELSEGARLELATDLREAFFMRFPHTWAVHCPPARDGSGENPHLHVMFSPRRVDQALDVGPKEWFSARATGAHKDRFWDEKRALQGVRYETAVLINAALEREGKAVAVSPERLRGRGHERSGVHYYQGDTPENRERIQAQQALLRDVFHPGENEMNLAFWEAQKRHEGIRDISREAMVAHVQARFWRHEQTPERQQERAQALERTLGHMWTRTGRVRGKALEREAPARPPLQVARQSRVWGPGWGQEAADLAHSGAHVQLERGMEVER